MRRLMLATVILTVAVTVVAQEPPQTQVHDACMNTEAIARLGSQPLGQYLQSVTALATPHSIAAAVGELHRFGIFAIFRVHDQPVPERQRDYATQHYAETLFVLLGDPPQRAAQEARNAINLAVSLTPPPGAEPLRPLTLAQLRTLAPNFDWRAYWGTRGVPDGGKLVASPTALLLLNGRMALATNADMDAWHSYLRWCWLRATAPLLSPPFVDAYFNFRGRKPPARAALCASAVAAFPAAAFADVPLRRDDFFGDMLRLHAWAARQVWVHLAGGS
ncbi:MAG: M13 family metallopeptidase N-terminal domain-containing protein [Terriglobales bacterium]